MMAINITNPSELHAKHLAQLKNDGKKNYGVLTVGGFNYTVTFPENDIRVCRRSATDINPSEINRTVFSTLFRALCSFFMRVSFILREKQIKARLIKIELEVKNDTSSPTVYKHLRFSIPGDGNVPSTEEHLISLASLKQDIVALTPHSHRPVIDVAHHNTEKEKLPSQFQDDYSPMIKRITDGLIEEITSLTDEITSAGNTQDVANKVARFTQRWTVLKNLHGKIQDISNRYIQLRINSQSEAAKEIIKQRMNALLSVVNSYSTKNLPTNELQLKLQQMENIVELLSRDTTLNTYAELYTASNPSDRECFVDLIKNPETTAAQWSFIINYLQKKQGAIKQGFLDQLENIKLLKKNNTRIHTYLNDREAFSKHFQTTVHSLGFEARTWFRNLKQQPTEVEDQASADREKCKRQLFEHIDSLKQLAERLRSLRQSKSALPPHEMQFIQDCEDQWDRRIQCIQALEHSIKTGKINSDLDLNVPAPTPLVQVKRIYLATSHQFPLFENLKSSLPDAFSEDNYQSQFNEIVDTIVSESKALNMRYDELTSADFDIDPALPILDTARREYVLQSFNYICLVKSQSGSSGGL